METTKVIAFDIGASSIKKGIVVFEDNLYKEIINIEKENLQEKDFEEVKKIVLKFIKENLIYSNKVSISTTGTIDENSIVISASKISNYKNINWNDIIKNEFENVEVSILNDGLASTWGEYFTKNEEKDMLINLVIGTGLGGGIIYQNELIRGATGQAGYFGQIKLDNNMKLEELVSVKGFEHLYNNKYKENISFNEIMNNKDYERVLDIIIETGYILGRAIGNIINIINPNVVTISGGFVVAIQGFIKNICDENIFIDSIKKGVKETSHKRSFEKVNIRLSTLLNNGGMIGAAILMINNKML